VIALFGILAASALGSIHCVAMCGPLVGLHGGTKSVRLALVHSLGRLATYATLGAAAGAVGSAVNLAGHLASVQRTATLLAGLTLITIGALSWGRYPLFPLSRSRQGKEGTTSPFAKGLIRIRSKRSVRTRAALMGMLTGLLPCGWLWAFVVTAGGTGHVLGGLGVMVFFWLGTVPAMVGVLGFLGPALARVRAKMPAITAVALIAVGLGTLALRWHDAGQATHCYLCTGAGS
jgi:hypothetical protein